MTYVPFDVTCLRFVVVNASLVAAAAVDTLLARMTAMPKPNSAATRTEDCISLYLLRNSIYIFRRLSFEELLLAEIKDLVVSSLHMFQKAIILGGYTTF